MRRQLLFWLIVLFGLHCCTLLTLQDDPFTQNAPQPTRSVSSTSSTTPTNAESPASDNTIPDKLDMANFFLVFSMTFLYQLIFIFFGGFYISVSLYQK